MEEPREYEPPREPDDAGESGRAPAAADAAAPPNALALPKPAPPPMAPLPLLLLAETRLAGLLALDEDCA